MTHSPRHHRLLKNTLRRSFPVALLGCLAGCGVAPYPLLAPQPLAMVAKSFATDRAFVTPDYQKTLSLGAKDRPIGSWYDVKGMQGSTNRDRTDVAALAGASTDAFQAYLGAHAGPVAVYVGGLGDEAQPWNP